jgi:HlyD family secretion protein
MKLSKRTWIYLSIAALLAIILFVAFLPDPIPVETATVARGPMRVTVDEDGKTRTVDRYVVTAPVSGRLQRIEIREGHEIAEGEVVARIDPAPMDAARSQELDAMVDAAASAVREAQAAAARARASVDQARRERARIAELAREGVVSQAQLDDATTAVETGRRDLAAAEAAVRSAGSNLEAARARALPNRPQATASASVEVQAPAAGRVLRIPERSSRIVQAGETLLEVGNANRLELVIDVLSEDAVRIEPGDPVIVDEWGGPHPLRGSVLVVEPSAFTKISALGIEEQRVNVIAGIENPPASLGDGYRIEASIVVWQDPGALQVPVSSLGRTGEEWSVFVVEDGKAVRRSIKVGERNQRSAVVLEGLSEGDRVIVHPGNEIADGVRVTPTPQ